MMKYLFLFLFICLNLVVASECQMWYEDNNLGKSGHFPQDAKEKFINPITWQNSLQTMDVYLIRANSLYIKNNQVTNYFIKNKILKLLKKYKIKLALDVRGATLRHASQKRKEILTKELKLIENIQRLGGNIDSINFQSPLSKSIERVKNRGKEYTFSYPLQQRIADIVYYAKVIHTQFPHIKFGLIDASPTKGYPYKESYKELSMAMKKENIMLDHIILDLPYTFIEKNKNGMTWEKAIEIEDFVQNTLHIKFGKIYHDSKGGRTSNLLFHNNVLKMAKKYATKGGMPDHCLLMSWYPYPSYTIPETEKYTQMYTFLKLAETINK